MVIAGVETVEPWCRRKEIVVPTLGKQIFEVTGDDKAKHFVMQRTSMAVQEELCVVASMPASKSIENIFIFEFLNVMLATERKEKKNKLDKSFSITGSYYQLLTTEIANFLNFDLLCLNNE